MNEDCLFNGDVILLNEINGTFVLIAMLYENLNVNMDEPKFIDRDQYPEPFNNDKILKTINCFDTKDISNKNENEYMVYKFNEEKLIDYLTSKVRQISETLIQDKNLKGAFLILKDYIPNQISSKLAKSLDIDLTEKINKISIYDTESDPEKQNAENQPPNKKLKPTLKKSKISTKGCQKMTSFFKIKQK